MILLWKWCIVVFLFYIKNEYFDIYLYNFTVENVQRYKIVVYTNVVPLPRLCVCVCVCGQNKRRSESETCQIEKLI